MSKYLCLCGAHYDNKAGADLHLDWAQHSEGHVIIKRKWRGRFKDAVLGFLTFFLGEKLLKCIGIMGVHGVFIHHFQYNWWESIISALCVGFLV